MKNFRQKFVDLQIRILSCSKQTLSIPLYNLRKSARFGLLVSVHITEQLPHQLKAASFGFGLALMPNMIVCSPNKYIYSDRQKLRSSVGWVNSFIVNQAY